MRLVIKTWESQKIQLKVSHSNLFKFFMFREWKKFSRASKKDENKISRGVLKMLLTHKFLNEIAMCDDRQMMMMAMGAPLLDWRWLRELWMSETSKKRKIVFSAAVCLFFFMPLFDEIINFLLPFLCSHHRHTANGIRIPEENWSYLISSNSFFSLHYDHC